LFFSHRPEREWETKWYVPGDYATNCRVADVLYRHTLHAAQASGLPVLEVNDVQQRGDGFGARLANAFADAFAAGYEHVIAVGSDCPRLHEVDWQTVVAHLERGAPVLGPTLDADGAYLIGLSRALFERDAFGALPWQTPDLLHALIRHATERFAHPPVQLVARGDVNSARDLWALLCAVPTRPFILIERLRAVLGCIAPRRARSAVRLVSADPVRAPSSRAPPAVESPIRS
jgi:glycosyltransferase A (GT-A) superfamily protein (DUF2064 family)